MENNEKKDLTLGQEIAVEIGGDVLGIGAGILVGGVMLGLVENIPGVGKPLKVLLKLGCYGLEIAAMQQVRRESQEYISNLCGAINDVKKIFTPKQEQVAAVESEAEVK